MIYDTDLISSIIKHLEEYSEFVGKDLRETPSAETRTGTLATLFAGMQVIPARLYDIESLPVPSIGVAVQLSTDKPIAFLGGGSVSLHAGRMIVTAAELVDGEEEYDNTLVRTGSLRSILADHFKNERQIDWYRYSFNAAGTSTLQGKFLCRDFNIVDVDEGRFITTFSIECCDDT